jgi:hypothetical protein
MMSFLGVSALALALASRPAAAFGDGPEISRSRGRKGGIVVLWPRVIAEAGVGHDDAVKVQNALADMARRLVPAAVVDVRPEPERVCPKETGCRGISIGAVLAEKDAGCAVVATVSVPGPSPTTLVPWVAEVGFRNKKMTIPFRNPPEAELIVNDFAPCADLDASLVAGAARVEDVVKSLVEPSGG